jgi:ethanolamine utilization cobalamin adenosyltransferase
MDKNGDYEELMLNIELENIFFNTITDIDNIMKIVYNIKSTDIL